jgi:hypothetical protein
LRLLAVARFAGRARYDDGAAMLDEVLRLASDTGEHRTLNQIECGQAVVAAVTGDEDRCRRLGERGIAIATAHDDTVAAAIAGWALRLLELGFGRYDDALIRLETVKSAGPLLPRAGRCGSHRGGSSGGSTGSGRRRAGTAGGVGGRHR